MRPDSAQIKCEVTGLNLIYFVFLLSYYNYKNQLQSTFKEMDKSSDQEIIAILSVLESRKPDYQPEFTDSEVLGHFKVNMKQPTDNICTGDLTQVPSIKLSEIRENYDELIGTPLPDGQDEADHNSHAKAKQSLFFHWIEQSFKLSHGESSDQPDIICSGGMLSEILGTPLKINVDWDFYATKIGGSVLMWTEPKIGGSPHNALKGVLFEALVTGCEIGDNLWDICHQKNWIIHRLRLGHLNIVLVSDVDAVDNEGSWVEVKLWEKKCMEFLHRSATGHSDKAVGIWSQLIVTNSKKILYGIRENSALVEIRLHTVEEYEKMANIKQKDKNICYQFLQRTLQFVQEELFWKDSQTGILQFYCKSKNGPVKGKSRGKKSTANNLRSRKVKCLLVKSLPEWFNEHRLIFNRLKAN